MDLFKVFTKEGNAIKLLIDLFLKTIDNKGYFIITPTDIKFVGEDKAQTKLIHLHLEKINFPVYKYTSTKPQLIVGLNMNHLLPIFKNVRKKDHVTLQITADKPDILNILVHHNGEEEAKASKNQIMMIKQDIYEDQYRDHNKDMQQLIDTYKCCPPISVDCTDFQKLKALGKNTSEIHVNTYPGFIEFQIDKEALYTQSVHFGEKDDKIEKVLSHVYDSSVIASVVKTSSISKDVKIYFATTENDTDDDYETENVPLRFTLMVSSLGKLDICIKSNSTIKSTI